MSTDLYEHQATVALSADEARRLTDRIKVGIEAVWQLIEQAWQGRVWIALGYSSWDDYCTREFGTSRIKLPREERHEVVASMRELGMSTRAIASATGTHYSTVSRELSGGVANATPTDTAPATGTDGKTYNARARREAGDESSSPSPVIGVDGKSYSRPAPVVESPEDKERRQEEERAKAREEAHGFTEAVIALENYAHPELLSTAFEKLRYSLRDFGVDVEYRLDAPPISEIKSLQAQLHAVIKTVVCVLNTVVDAESDD